MGDMGLQGAYGAQGAADALRQLIKDRLAQQMATQEMTLRQSQETRLGEEHAAAMQDRLDQHAAIRQEHQTGLANTLGDQIPAGTEMAPTDQGVGLLQSGGRGSLLRGNMTLPSTQMAGGMTMPDDTGGSQITGTLRSMDSPEALRSYTKLPSEKQGEYADTAAAKVEAARVAAENRTHDDEQKAQDRLAQIKAAAESRPASEQGWTIQQGMVGGKPGWVRINSRTGAVQPVSPGDITPKPSAQETEHTRTNTEAHDTLNQLDQAIDAAKDLIGPGSGRISNLEQMAGSADPRIQALGVKMKAAKMRVDHAVTGSVRSGASPQMMQQWDNILANKVTPEGLKAGVQAMREILGGGTPAPTTSGGTVEKWGRDANGNLVKQ